MRIDLSITTVAVDVSPYQGVGLHPVIGCDRILYIN